MSTIVLKQKPIQLRYNDESNVVVHPENEDRMVISSAEAVLAILRWGEVTTQQSVLQEQLRELLSKLYQWCDVHSDRIYQAYIQVRESYTRLEFIVMQKDVPRDAELSDILTDLDLEAFNDPQFSAVRMDVLCIPRCSADSMQAFVNLSKSICIAEFPDA